MSDDTTDRARVAVENIDWDTSRTVTDLIASQARMLSILPLAHLEAFLSRGESVGPLLDPTGYRAYGRSIRAARRMVVATLRWIGEVQAALEESS
jgi:hypothetical protein